MPIPFYLIVAADVKGCIGKNGKIPWHLSEDLAYFKRLTSTTKNSAKRNAVMMGRKTWESLPGQFKPLSHRLNIVITRTPEILPAEVDTFPSLSEAVSALHADASYQSQIESVFIIGGGRLYEEAMRIGLPEKIFLTLVKAVFDCDTFFPLDSLEKDPRYHSIDESALQTENGLSFTFRTYQLKEGLNLP